MTLEIAVTSPSFSRNKVLVNELRKLFSSIKLNTEGSRFNQEQLIQFLSTAQGAIVGLDIINKEVLGCLPDLKIISKYGVGLDNIDQVSMREHDVTLGWTPGVNKYAVAEQTIGCMIGLARNLFGSSRSIVNGSWIKYGGFQLREATVGLIGLGNVGQQVVKLLRPFGCNILANDVENREQFAREWAVNLVDKERIFTESNIISLHVPFTIDTENMINRNVLNVMKNNSFLINTSRGGIVNEIDLRDALQQKIISGACCDVFTKEPCLDNPLIQLDNFFATPHIGGNSKEAILAMGRSAIEHLRKYFYG